MKVKFMSAGNSVKLVIFLLLAFVAVGDVFLPEPLKGASKQIKATVNNLVLGILPREGFKDPHERTEKAVEEMEQEAGSQP
ncbi:MULTISPECIES: hypothetical protein [Cyanophyceae]|uniref:hypothetical protein n=1 Tax=Cyanophyceae TaxID=3028117 RepID=UPI0002E5EA07|nr:MULTISPECIES: hypothetical protein [Cyanophyceae]SMH38778.1 hypothetical protein SAMN06272755_0948 [Picosynechococcus sp. OG1]SMQ78069.1 hypothetical protein SAMN06272774_0228 [Synechococcus sp. 7002]